MTDMFFYGGVGFCILLCFYIFIRICSKGVFVSWFEAKTKQKESEMNIAEIKDDWERLKAYKQFGYAKEAMNDRDYYIRLNAYKKHGFTKEAMQDESATIRLNAYKKHGYTKEALEDEDWEIRFRAHEALGFTKEALNDSNPIIRQKAEEYFKNK